MPSLIPEEDLQRAREKYAREHPAPPTHAEILCRVAREDLSLTVAQLADAAERSRSWVRRTLKQNGIVLIKPPKKRRIRVKCGALCAACGHPLGGRLAMNMRQQTHCIGNIRHLHWSNPNSYVCDKRHCLSFNYDAEGKPVACECPDFVAPAEVQTQMELRTEVETDNGNVCLPAAE
jgi:hypothetical protein